MGARKRDLDETRRCIYIALANIKNQKPIWDDLAGTLANALAHHSQLMSPKEAERFTADLLTGFSWSGSSDDLKRDRIRAEEAAERLRELRDELTRREDAS